MARNDNESRGGDMWHKKCLIKMVHGIRILKGYLKASWDCIRRVSVRMWKHMCSWSKKLLMMIKCGTNIIIKQRQIDGKMIKHGSLFFTVLLYLLVTEQSKFVWWKSVDILKFIPDPREYLSTVIISIIIGFSLIFMCIILFVYQKAKKNNNLKLWHKWTLFPLYILLVIADLFLLPAMPLGGVQGITYLISVIFLVAVFVKALGDKLEELLMKQWYVFYWYIFLMVWYIGWTKGLANTQGNDLAYKSIFWLGVVWFITIIIVVFKPNPRLRKNSGKQ
jgi:hypothetical protein